MVYHLNTFIGWSHPEGTDEPVAVFQTRFSFHMDVEPDGRNGRTVAYTRAQMQEKLGNKMYPPVPHDQGLMRAALEQYPASEQAHPASASAHLDIA